MSVSLTINSPDGHTFALTVPLNSVASADGNTTYSETQAQVAAFASRTAHAVIGDKGQRVAPSFTIMSRRLLESCQSSEREPGPLSLIRMPSS